MTRRRTRTAVGALFAALASIAGLAGCTGEPPVISRVFAQPIFVRDLERKVAYGRLGVFLVATDPDGQEDLSAFYVINDEAELFWKVEAASWVTSTAEGESWIGSNAIAMPDASAPPEGDYRVVLQDQGGDTVEQTFALPSLPLPEEEGWPSATIGEEAISVANPQEVTEAWFYARDGKFQVALAVPKETNSLALARVREAAPGFGTGSIVWIYGYDRSKLRGLLVGPYRAP